MKRLWMITALAGALTACESGNWWGDGPEPNYGVFTFDTAEQTVEVTPATQSVRIEGRYLKPADEKHRGSVMLMLSETTTARNGKHFLYDRNMVAFTEGENGTFYSDVTIYPENITEEVRICYYLPSVRSNSNDPETYPDRINELTVILRPAATEQPDAR